MISGDDYDDFEYSIFKAHFENFQEEAPATSLLRCFVTIYASLNTRHLTLTHLHKHSERLT